jgi:non-specific serine/threonine protein kinase
MPPASPAATLRTSAGFLPAEVDSFVGRRRELAEARRLFANAPLVTLAGPGGVGKTRLVLRTATALSRTFRDGVCFVPLGDFRDPALLTQALADGLGLREQSNALTLDDIIGYLAERRTLLVLDNCEHLLDGAAALADDVLRRCPDVRLLVTSREPLSIAGEAVLRVPPLTVPDLRQPVTPQSLPQYESVNLFIDRAVRARPDFVLTDGNCRDVAKICHRLDGVPLALELAAARLRSLSPRDLAERLENKYSLLTQGSRVAPSRHQTLRLCVDWSYEQCSAEERLLWSRLSVFVGSFELDAVEAVCGFGDLEPAQMVSLLGQLVDKSVVTRDGDADSSQFRMLETLRDYAVEKCEETGEKGDLLARHAAWYRAFVETARDELVGPDQISWMARLDRELPNIRAAIDHSSGASGSREAQAIAGALHMHWISRGLLSEGRHWLTRAIGEDRSPSAELEQALYSGVAITGFQGDTDAAAVWVEMCEKASAALGDEASTAYAASATGMLALFRGELEGAVADLDRAVIGFRASAIINRELEILIGLALAAGLAGYREKSQACHERILSITQDRQESWYRAYSLWALGIALWRDGQPADARAKLDQSLQLRRSMNDLMGSVWCLEGLAFVAAAEGDAPRAAVLLGSCEALAALAGVPAATFAELAQAHADTAEAAKSSLGDGPFERSFTYGAGLDVSDAVAFALGEALPEGPEATGSTWSVLTPRERQVADLVAKGMTNAEIADKLVISQRTAEGHVENILTKLAFGSRTQIAAWVADLA